MELEDIKRVRCGCGKVYPLASIINNEDEDADQEYKAHNNEMCKCCIRKEMAELRGVHTDEAIARSTELQAMVS